MPRYQRPFETLGLGARPVLLAPLAGVSDHPFRRTCTALGADLTYVEMISATALIYESQRTFDMLARHPDEKILGVQVTGRSVDDTAQAFARFDKMSFDTIDINMGCPVAKVIKTGCGSAILKDPERVFATIKACRNETDKPFSAKIRIGWDRGHINGVEVAQAIAEGGADWLVVHGRTRSDDYSVAVDLDEIAAIKTAVNIPVIGNGNIFDADDASYMVERTNVDGLMVSRGALGDPWVFARIKGLEFGAHVSPADWHRSVVQHLRWQQEAYGDQGRAAVCMRKNLLWYCKGWPGIKAWKDEISHATSITEMLAIVDHVCASLELQGHKYRDSCGAGQPSQRFQWDPKWDMDRRLDRGVGTDMMDAEPGKIRTNADMTVT